MFRYLLGVLIASTLVLATLADTGTPYPAGTRVKVVTSAGTVSGVLQDRTLAGWLLVRDQVLGTPTAIPEKSVGFIRAEAETATAPGTSARAATIHDRLPTVAVEAFSGHYVFGQPRVVQRIRFAFTPFPGSTEEVEGVTVLEKHAFTLGHYDRFKVPAWVAMRWTRENHDQSEGVPTHPRNFKADPDLPPYARTGKDYQHSEFGFERGHMARHQDLIGFPAPGDARRGTREGCLMSNIVPQQRKGHTVWGKP